MEKILISIVLMGGVIDLLPASLEKEIGDTSVERKSALDLLKAVAVSDNCIEEFEQIQREQQKKGSREGIGLDVWSDLLDRGKSKRMEQAEKNRAEGFIK